MKKIAAAKKETTKARAGKNSFPQAPFLFARPSVILAKLLPVAAGGGQLKVVSGIFLKMSSNFF
ncbi:MAG: hypothetical protein A2998_03435 [Candidatus Staskawiczbacteria bacterium RIFCSPLOWO2_01_FULL_37_25b]|uniref:Uncharacterized protein n=1 Tax=Candidatus Staskawiczbacteria bacterium RIFCSPLOWO2_01_FULL_37_25b TaxID=1802213 RepID=A0A1G2IBS3_9BACT|nr:MAG: hypothetical protein A2998_03435 [Candidatus Staskawiczbacteria bacterium RIFCSPLOWO2_01_FULL_37_25b]